MTATIARTLGGKRVKKFINTTPLRVRIFLSLSVQQWRQGL